MGPEGAIPLRSNFQMNIGFKYAIIPVEERLTIKSQQENEDFLNKTSLGVLDSPEAGLSLNQYLENRMTNRASE